MLPACKRVFALIVIVVLCRCSGQIKPYLFKDILVRILKLNFKAYGVPLNNGYLAVRVLKHTVLPYAHIGHVGRNGAASNIGVFALLYHEPPRYID